MNNKDNGDTGMTFFDFVSKKPIQAFILFLSVTIVLFVFSMFYKVKVGGLEIDKYSNNPEEQQKPLSKTEIPNKPVSTPNTNEKKIPQKNPSDKNIYNGLLTGIIVDEKGDPVPDANISCQNCSDIYETVSDNNGHFSFKYKTIIVSEIQQVEVLFRKGAKNTKQTFSIYQNSTNNIELK